MKTVLEVTDSIFAGIALSYLKDNDIDAVLIDEHSSGWARARMLVPIRMQVPDDQAEKALALLNCFKDAATDLPTEANEG